MVHIETAEAYVGELGCLQSVEIARAKIAFNQLLNEEIERGAYGEVSYKLTN